MANVIFYEKPGCINNTKQKKLLQNAGHTLDVRNLLTTSWTLEKLRPFFCDRPVEEWFNPTAPRIKSGEIIPKQLDEKTALHLMIADPLLIRRPLIQVKEVFQVGFDVKQIDSWIGLNSLNPKIEDLETCPNARQ
ncbi:putative nitrogenase-associated protein [cyanobacterium endosymbiont of Rhopalodia gibberula]|uniref:ArsC/Spx/MgsR family protein n=1 Tax=cyanobacterium endosymbiont of Rhopalodia gibberula TaxID=1763363 RepID=UPI000DC7168D|nr:ArsC/Spx/MgsR family protein [cyanobacterium endosymbiont of Rhopalodia gibberula]BBA79948.1 putative nitrogenase-associated protein [cyanobacterium endosymbiont of Rhopalodia gibberula]